MHRLARLSLLFGLLALGCQESDNTTPSTPCDDVTCSDHGNCVVLDGQPNCACEADHMPDGINGLNCVPFGGGSIDGRGGPSGMGGQPASGGMTSAGGAMGGGGNMPGGAMGGGGTPGGSMQDGGSPAGGRPAMDSGREPDLCDRISCSGHGQCVVLDDRPTCACEEGYAPDPVNGLNCVPFTPGMWRDAEPPVIPDASPVPDARPRPDAAPHFDGGPSDAAAAGDAWVAHDANIVDADLEQDATPDASGVHDANMNDGGFDAAAVNEAGPQGGIDDAAAPDADPFDAEGSPLADAERLPDAAPLVDAEPVADAALPVVPLDRCDAPYCVGDDREENVDEGIICLDERYPFWPSVGATGIDGRMERRSDVPGEPIIEDHFAGLTWMGCPLGVSGQHCSNGAPAMAMGSQHAFRCEQAAWGGHDDWQAPSGLMVETLMYRQRTGQGIFDEGLFPYPSTRRLVRVEQNRQGQNISFLSTYVDASSGRMYVTARGRAEDMFQVYCVRPTDGGPLPSEVRRCFRRSPAEEQEHTLEDLGTGLVWTGCFAGLSGPDCNEGQGGAGTHRHSIRFCEDLEYAGHDDWMMPSVDQLNTLTDNVRQPNGTRLSGFMSGLFETETRLWAADRVGVNGYSSFYALDTRPPIHVETQLERNGGNLFCVRAGPWAQTIEYPRDTCMEIVPFRVDAQWDQDAPRFRTTPGGPDTPGEPIIEDALNGIDWTGCVSGVTGDQCDGGERRALQSAEDATRYCARLEWAGFDDWRLPAYREFASLVDFDSPETPPLSAGIAALFPPLAAAGQQTFHIQGAARFDVRSVTRNEDHRFDGPVYCVRDRDGASPQSEIQCLETSLWYAQEPVVTDAVAGLQWTACNLNGNGRGCTNAGAERMTYAQAVDACDALNWAGQEDWRLPSMAEGVRLIDHDETPTRANIEAFAGNMTVWTEDRRSADQMWLTGAYPQPANVRSAQWVRCVRDL